MLNSSWDTVMVVAGLVVVLFVVFVVVWPLAFTYRFAEHALEVRFVGLFSIVRIHYDSIREVTKVNAVQAWFPPSMEMFNAARAGNRIFARCIVVIRRTRGLRKLVIVTPADPDGFVRELSLRSRAARSG